MLLPIVFTQHTLTYFADRIVSMYTLPNSWPPVSAHRDCVMNMSKQSRYMDPIPITSSNDISDRKDRV